MPPKELIEEVDKLVGPRRRSEFLTKAATKELQREKLLRLTRKVSKLPPDGGIPECHEGGGLPPDHACGESRQV